MLGLTVTVYFEVVSWFGLIGSGQKRGREEEEEEEGEVGKSKRCRWVGRRKNRGD